MLSGDTRSAHDELKRKLRPFVARRVPAADIDDVLQDVFVRLHRSLWSLEDQDRFGPWLYRVARSAVAENFRQRARHPIVQQPEETATSPADGDDGELLKSTLAEYAAFAITHLPSPYREALTMTDLHGLTQEAAAEMAGISLSGMKSRVQRGRQKLRELIEDCCKIALDARGRVIECEARKPTECDCSKPRTSS